MTQTAVQPPEYRRSWLGLVIVAALVVQWAMLWARSVYWYDTIIVRQPFGNGHVEIQALSTSGIVSLDLFVPKGSFLSEQLGIMLISLRRESALAARVRVNQLPSIGVNTDGFFTNVPYWSLIALTLLAYFAVGRFRRRRFERRATRTGA